MSKNGAVKRGVCVIENGYIKETIESEIRMENDKLIAKSLTTSEEFEVSKDCNVSMNFIGFQKNFLELLEEKFDEFIHGEITEKNEFLIPEILMTLIKENKIKGVAKEASSKWMGITYREDVAEFKESINKLIADGKYPNKLW